ncbi:G5 domain-containing protein [Curtobacterium albidum]|uniref:G5 domain-containing protein n=1 Tax=Curtobacterium citreum TaxID=2036 RepID=UPI00202749E0|nr:G5 domain-containing protein [Curtobacterium albidum]MCL9665381.1 G5 domain-containing protein [Curtobacterium albidum]
MRWAALRTKTKATIVVAVAATIWLGGVGSAGALVGAVASNAADARPVTAVADAETARPEATRTPTPTPTPVVAVSEETEDTAIPFERTSVDDPALPKGQSKVTTAGVDGVETTTWRVTTTDGVETDRVEVGKEVTKTPVAEVTAIGSYVAPAPVAPAPAPVQQAPAAPAPVQQAPAQGTITPGAFCSDAQSGAVAQAANGRSYQCGGKGPDANGHLHWNTM